MDVRPRRRNLPSVTLHTTNPVTSKYEKEERIVAENWAALTPLVFVFFKENLSRNICLF